MSRAQFHGHAGPLLVLPALVAALCLAGCRRGGQAPAPEAASPVIIGVAAPFTGPNSKMGDDIWKGAQLAAEEWNERAGVLGRPIQLVRRDDESKPNQAVSIARELINEAVVGTIGHFNSGCTIPSSEVFTEHRIPLITPASTNPQVTDRGYRYVFRVCGRDDQQGRVGAEYTARRLQLHRVAVLHDKTPYGQGLADEYKKSAAALGLEVVYYGGVGSDELDFRSVITAMKAGDPQLLYFGGLYGQAGPLLIQAREAGLNAAFMSGDGVIDIEFLKTAGNFAEGAYLTFGPDPEQVPSAKAFLEKYRSRWGEPGPYSVYAYDATNVLLTGLEQAGSTDGAAVAEALHRGTFDTAMGPIRFDDKGDITGTYYVMWVVRDGKFVVQE